MVFYIFVTGGVISGLGKGIVTSSIALLLQSRGYSVAPVKADGYLNVDAGTMNPIEHGEVFVLDDGTETDMDLGNYERFLNVSLDGRNILTTGKIMRAVLQKERRGDYLGKTVQIIPHVTGEIKAQLREAAHGKDFCIVEIGGTVGDLENMIFLEAAREIRMENRGRTVFVHVTLVPVVDVVGEQKSKPTQHSVRELMRMGIQPDIIVCRSHNVLKQRVRDKIALFCNTGHVFSNPDLKTPYQCPLFLEEQGLGLTLETLLGLEPREPKLDQWHTFVNNLLNPEGRVRIAITGKYTELKDSYVSIFEALAHAGAFHKVAVDVECIETTDLSYEEAREKLRAFHGVIVPGGFGSRGTEGKINCIRVCREGSIPFLGLCFGMQLAVVEYARDVVGIKDAVSSELADGGTAIIHMMETQKKIMGMGGTMRLGSYEARLSEGSLAYRLYGSPTVRERHRHRYEVNTEFVDALEEAGMLFSGRSPDGHLMEFAEILSHPFFIGTQAHPELKSKPLNPHPLFRGFVGACLDRSVRAS